MAELAIKGHSTKGKEVIEILEMLGGINTHNLYGDENYAYYTIDSDKEIKAGIYVFGDEELLSFTLEEFLEKSPYKVGDKVIVKGLSEYPKIINFMKWFDGDIHYSFDNETWFLPSALNLYKEETMEVKCIAIKGHKTRYKEVIELLEMLGGKNEQGHCGHNPNIAYYISHKNTIICDCAPYSGDVYTLEEFLEKFPYKIGDRVSSKYLKNYKIEKMEWEDTNNRVIYKLQGMGWYNASELQPYEEETMEENLTIQDIRDNNAEWLLNKLEGMSVKKVLQTISDLYDKLRKPQYPKTFVECCDVLSISPYYNLRYHTYEYGYGEFTTINKLCSLQDKLNTLGKLLICRDAYWVIAGKELGLGKPWKPDWDNYDDTKYCIYTTENIISLDLFGVDNKILAFPTEKMRNAFYKNFKELIEACKELL